MKFATQCLQPADIKALLAGIVPASQSELWEEHFSACESCRMAMAGQVGDQEWWREAERSLMNASISEERDTVKSETDEGESIEELLKLLGPTDDPQMLGRIGSYEVLGVLGRGGMGVVFKAFDAPLNRFVAIKMLLPHLAASGAARKRFAREGQAAAAVIDDNVMPIYSVAEWQGVPYLVTQYSRGATLQKRIQDQGPLELKEILRIGMQTARGLAAAHAQGLVHRDVKPSNILLDGTVERALLTDFGLALAVDDASITRTGIIAGTPQYMSPEQARGGSVDARSDLFGLGCVLYAMCTGHPPFRADSSYAILRMITDNEPRSIREINPDIPEWLCLLISRLMAKSPDARFGNALEVAALLEQGLAHVQQPASVPLPVSLLPRAASRRSIFNVTRKGVIAMLGTIGMTFFGGMVLMQATEAPDISGQWASDEWGTVVLNSKNGRYEGTMSNALFGLGGLSTPHDVHPQSNGAKCAACHQGPTGKIELKWSRGERRFNGTWRTSEDSGGKISIRLVDNEIRGAWTTAKNTQKESDTPRLADLLWTRSPAEEARSSQLLAAPAMSGGELVHKQQSIAPELQPLTKALANTQTLVLVVDDMLWKHHRLPVSFDDESFKQLAGAILKALGPEGVSKNLLRDNFSAQLHVRFSEKRYEEFGKNIPNVIALLKKSADARQQAKTEATTRELLGNEQRTNIEQP
jgi:serine/threonine protein kinase